MKEGIHAFGVVFVLLSSIGCTGDVRGLTPCCKITTTDVDEPTGPENQINFGDTPVGVTTRKRLRITNLGDGTVSITHFTMDGIWSNSTYEFNLGIGRRELAIESGQSVGVDISFVAFTEMAEPVVVELTIHGNGTDSNRDARVDQVVTIKGRGAVDTIECSPNPMNFGDVAIGTTRTLELTIRNHLGAAIDVTVKRDGAGNAQITVNGTGWFELLTPVSASGSIVPRSTDGSPALLKPNESLAVAIRYSPNDGMGDDGVLPLMTCANALCEHDVRLQGRGL
jgi:hypothetical protein